MSTEESKVIDMFSRKKQQDDSAELVSFDFEEIKKANALKAEKLDRERRKHNSKVKKDYQITPKK
jgi:hypothetical protein